MTTSTITITVNYNTDELKYIAHKAGGWRPTVINTIEPAVYDSNGIEISPAVTEEIPNPISWTAPVGEFAKKVVADSLASFVEEKMKTEINQQINSMKAVMSEAVSVVVTEG
jgi:hypothetical protein